MQPQFKSLDPGKTESRRKDKEVTAQECPPFEEALVARLDSLMGLALRLVRGDRPLAEDLVQEACLRAFKGHKSLRSPENMKAWLSKILVNTYLKEFRRRSGEPPIVDVELTEEMLESCYAQPSVTPEEELFESVLDSGVQQALDNLQVEFRTVVWLADVEELTHKEISEVIDRPIGTVASRLYRGHNLLRHYLGEYARRRRLIVK